MYERSSWGHENNRKDLFQKMSKRPVWIPIIISSFVVCFSLFPNNNSLNLQPHECFEFATK
jgi:hypothetical protein